MVGVQFSSSLAARLFPFFGVAGSSISRDDVVGVVGLGCCSSDPINVVEVDAVISVGGSEVASGTTTVKSPEGAGIDLATVAGKADVADVVAGVEDELEAVISSVLPGETSDPFSFLFWACPSLSIFCRGFADSPTF